MGRGKSPETRLIRVARPQGLRMPTGLPTLVYQGTIGFQMWAGQPASELVMKAALEKTFGS
jgi:shikimate 5-dehydrogenase